MATKKKNQVTVSKIQLDTPTHDKNHAELITANRQQLDRIKASTLYPTEPAVQAAVTALSKSTDSLEKRLSAIEANRAENETLVLGRSGDLAAVHRDRDTLRATMNAVTRGSADALHAWNCIVQEKSAPVPSEGPPIHLVLKNSHTTAGTVTAKCKGVSGAGSYLFCFTTDPNAAPGVGQIVSSTGSKCEIVGQALGHVLYARVAVTRPKVGQSAWSDPVQLLVR